MLPLDDPMPQACKQGAAGRAWRMNVAAVITALGLDPTRNGIIASWIVEAPFAHPMWHSYSLTLCHLRPLSNLPPPIFYLEGATHEFLLHALAPDVPRAPQLDGAPPAWLVPTNFAAQMLERSDVAAIRKVDAAIDLILTGELNPDADALRQWCAIFGDNMLRKASK